MAERAAARHQGTVAGASAADSRGVALRTLLLGLVAGAWLVLWLWSASPYARYLDHGRWSELGVLAAICKAVPEGALVVPALLYASGWVLMIAAMMLPTTIPILEMFRRMTAQRADHRRLLSLVILGYFVAWLGFGLVAHLLDGLLRAGAERTPWLALHGWVVGAGVLAGAGLFQFSALKYRCLERCHTPLAFIFGRWHGRRPALEAWRLGVDHGLFCVGCCWALMLLMFVVGTGNIGWMLGLAAVMAAEKNLPIGRQLRTPLGVALIVWAVGIVAVNTGWINLA